MRTAIEGAGHAVGSELPAGARGFAVNSVVGERIPLYPYPYATATATEAPADVTPMAAA